MRLWKGRGKFRTHDLGNILTYILLVRMPSVSRSIYIYHIEVYTAEVKKVEGLTLPVNGRTEMPPALE